MKPLTHALELRCPALPVVRIGLVGLGQRGMATLARYAHIEGAEIRLVADISEERMAEANRLLRDTNRPEAFSIGGEEGWKEACRREDIDLIYICTEWDTHCRIAVEAMEAGKHVAVEVPAATTVDECRLLVETALRTHRHCFMTENCCYDFFALSTLNAVKAGRIGKITHCEGAYVHDLRETFGLTGSAADASRLWMARSCALHGGNPYPTHGMGPIGWLLGLHRGDRMDYLVSLTANADVGNDVLGKVNSTLIRTVRGVSILLQFDVTTPRPYSRLQTVCGTEGFIQKYPQPTLQTLDRSDAFVGAEALAEMDKYSTDDASRLWKEGRTKGVVNEMNYAMDSRLIYCLRHGLPLDIDVYDAAEWSCLAELSRISAEEGSRPVAIPDFTNGYWQELQGHRFF